MERGMCPTLSGNGIRRRTIVRPMLPGPRKVVAMKYNSQREELILTRDPGAFLKDSPPGKREPRWKGKEPLPEFSVSLIL